MTLRRYFIAGLLVWIPLGITLWVLKVLVDMMDQSLLLLPESYRTEALFGFHVPGLGIILTVAIVVLDAAPVALDVGSDTPVVAREPVMTNAVLVIPALAVVRDEADVIIVDAKSLQSPHGAERIRGAIEQFYNRV